MIRFYVFLSLMTLVSLFVRGETFDRWRFGVGAKCGITTVDYPGSAKNADFVFSYGVSIPVGFSITDWLEIRSGLDFRKTGYSDSAQFPEENEVRDYTYSTSSYILGIPVELAFYPIPAKPVYIFLGIDNSVVAGSSYGYSAPDDLPLSGHADAKRYNIDFLCGIGADINRHFSVDLRYYRGLNGYYRHSSGFNTNAFFVSLNYWF